MPITPAHINSVRPLQPQPASRQEQVAGARQLQAAYRDFVGKTFYGEMLKAMRSTVGQPAFFHGGRTEEVFRAQLDQQLADRMSDASADKLADPMFRLQFPQQAALLAEEEKKPATQLGDLAGLRRR